MAIAGGDVTQCEVSSNGGCRPQVFFFLLFGCLEKPWATNWLASPRRYLRGGVVWRKWMQGLVFVVPRCGERDRVVEAL